MNFYYVILGIGVILIILTLVVVIPAVQYLESFGNQEARFGGPDGPLCNIDDWPIGGENTWPAQVLTASAGANTAGIQPGDTIIRVNDLEINSTYDLVEWRDLLPDVKYGDLVNVIALRDGQEMEFDVQVSQHTDVFGTYLVIGVDVPTYEIGMGTSPCNLFVTMTDDIEFSSGELNVTIAKIGMFAFVGVGLGFILVILILVIRPKITTLKEDLNDWEDQFLEDEYVVTLSTTKPKGKTDGEKIFNVVSNVFPELRAQDAGLPRKKYGGIVKNSNGYEFDVFEVFDEYDVFAVKHFGDKPVSKKMIQEACDQVKTCEKDKKVKKQVKVDSLYIERLLIVGKTFEDDFKSLTDYIADKIDDADEQTEQLMDSIDCDFSLDLILEDENGYRVLWVEP